MGKQNDVHRRKGSRKLSSESSGGDYETPRSSRSGGKSNGNGQQPKLVLMNAKTASIGVCAMAFIAVLAFYIYGLIFERRHNPFQLSTLPPAASYDTFNQTAWSTYRPHLYFGLKTPRPDSPVFGMLWYEQPRDFNDPQQMQIQLRHWCDQNDGVLAMWNAHDGRSFGAQTVSDQRLKLTLKTDWFNHGVSSWRARVGAEKTNASDWSGRQISLIFYFAAQGNRGGSSTSISPELKQKGEKQFEVLSGENDALGPFSFSLKNAKNTKQFSHFAFETDHPMDDLLVHVNAILLRSMTLNGEGDSLALPNEIVRGGEMNAEKTSFVAVQITLRENAIVEANFEMESDKKSDAATKNFDGIFSERLKNFERKFNEAFSNEDSSIPVEHRPMALSALSNLLGGVGVWHGHSLMRSQHFSSAGSSPPAPAHPYGPLRLLSAVPSRPFFPRGFIWDEGFHQLLVYRFDPKLTLQIIASYLDAMNADGWIPREVVLDPEARAKIPPEFLVQSDAVANPPMFFYLIEKMLKNTKIVKDYGREIRRLYPRLRQWYLWLKETQAGPKPGSFRWRGRNDTGTQLNPNTLASGLDDYPRATHPNDQEYHLDLFCWMGYSARVLRQLAEFSQERDFMPELDEDQRRFNDPSLLDQLHWSPKAGRFADFGLHSTKVKLVDKRVPNSDEIVRVRAVLEPPKLRWVDDVNGYVNLFPMLLRILPPDSARLTAILEQLDNEKDLWSPYGLRSLATWSPYYKAYNTRDSGPYWRGQVWLSCNYLALDALRHYAASTSENAALARKLYTELRRRLVSTVSGEFTRTGTFWEQYSDETGAGQGTRPFTGWTALVLNALAENYD